MFQELIQKAADAYSGQVAFVLYSKPHSGWLQAIFQKDETLNYSKDFTETGFIFSPFDGASASVILQADEILNAKIDLEKPVADAFDHEEKIQQDDRERYLAMITKALVEIEKGDLKKVVLSRRIEVDHDSGPLVLFQRVLHEYPNAFCYLWHHPQVGTWIGATPEILIKSDGRHFKTMSLAGTQSALEFAKPEWTHKELGEQQMVTDYIEDALKGVAVSVVKSDMETIRAGDLWHLRTKLTGRFAPEAFGEVLRALHPTPAVCGTPLENAKAFIYAHEGYARTFYTGFLGELNMVTEVPRNKNRKNHEHNAYRTVVKKSELYVNLRCMIVHREKAEIFVGGGITADSAPEKEWEETVFKSSTMLRVFKHK